MNHNIKQIVMHGQVTGTTQYICLPDYMSRGKMWDGLFHISGYILL